MTLQEHIKYAVDNFDKTEKTKSSTFFDKGSRAIPLVIIAGYHRTSREYDYLAKLGVDINGKLLFVVGAILSSEIQSKMEAKDMIIEEEANFNSSVFSEGSTERFYNKYKLAV